MATILDSVRKIADRRRHDFMQNTIALEQSQLLDQLHTLGECLMEDDSREGQIVTRRCIDFVVAVGAFKFPNTWNDAMHGRFHGRDTVEVVRG